MSELKWKWAYYPYLDAPNKQKESALKAGYIKVVSKDEADKVIEEKDKELRRHKYRRCMAMAKLSVKDDYAPWNMKWHERWLELAEKFKEAK